MEKLRRWYDVDFKFENPSAANCTFTGVVKKDQTLEYLLDLISKTSNVKFEMVKMPKNNKKMIKIRKNQ